jgi:hypothetical protein
MKQAMQALFAALVLVFAAQVFAEPVSIENDLDGNASALQSS